MFICPWVNCQVSNYCDPELVDALEDYQLKDGMFIKSFSVSLPSFSKTNIHPTDTINMQLADKSTYWIVLASSNKKAGLAKLLMYDSNNNLMATIENSSALTYDAKEIKTSEPTEYYFIVSFDKGNEGCAGIAIYNIPGYKIKGKY